MDEPLPGLTEAEHELVTSYRRVLELLTRLDPTRDSVTVAGATRAAEALQGEVARLLAALRAMPGRGQDELYPAALAWLASGKVRLENGRARVEDAGAPRGAALLNPLPPLLPVNKPPA